jgi:hypothetical protein
VDQGDERRSLRPALIPAEKLEEGFQRFPGGRMEALLSAVVAGLVPATPVFSGAVPAEALESRQIEATQTL